MSQSHQAIVTLRYVEYNLVMWYFAYQHGNLKNTLVIFHPVSSGKSGCICPAGNPSSYVVLEDDHMGVV